MPTKRNRKTLPKVFPAYDIKLLGQEILQQPKSQSFQSVHFLCSAFVALSVAFLEIASTCSPSLPGAQTWVHRKLISGSDIALSPSSCPTVELAHVLFVPVSAFKDLHVIEPLQGVCPSSPFSRLQLEPTPLKGKDNDLCYSF